MQENHHPTNTYFKNCMVKRLINRPKSKIGEKVRISKTKKKFALKKADPPTYHIQDLKGELIKGSFYEPELQKSTVDFFRIEKIIKRRTRKNGEKEAYVKRQGYCRDLNSWRPISELHKI